MGVAPVALCPLGPDRGTWQAGILHQTFRKEAPMAAAQKRATRTPASNGPTWRDVTPAGVVLVSGPEEYLGIRAMDRVRAQVRAASPDVEVSRINASSYEAGTLLMQV